MQGISAGGGRWRSARAGGPSFHLALNNVRVKDNRIPPRGFTNAAFAAFDGEPVGATYADGQYWDDVTYPVGAGGGRRRGDALLPDRVARVRRVPARRERHQRRRQHPLRPLGRARQARAGRDGARVRRARRRARSPSARQRVARAQERFRKTLRQGVGASATRVEAAGPDLRRRVARRAHRRRRGQAARARSAAPKDRAAPAQNITPDQLGHGTSCPVPCADDRALRHERPRRRARSAWPRRSSGESSERRLRRPPARGARRRVPARRSRARRRSPRRRAASRSAGRARSPAAKTPTPAASTCRRSIARPIRTATSRAPRPSRRAGSRSCDSFAGLAGCATSGTAAGDHGLLRERDRTVGAALYGGAIPMITRRGMQALGLLALAVLLGLAHGTRGERAPDLLRASSRTATASPPAIARTRAASAT